MTNKTKKTVFLNSISSDIGIALAKRYSYEGYTVAGTYRSEKLLDQLKDIPNCHLFYCDLADPKSVTKSNQEFAKLGLEWETFISCASMPPPLTSFFDSDFEEWSLSIHVNCIEQMRALHELYPLRAKGQEVNAIYFAGPGTNNAVKNFSALTVSKTMLIKMCELLDAENDDLNVFIVGPGWTKTKTHDTILNDPNVSAEKKQETLNFINNHEGTSMDDIYDCLRFLSVSGKEVAGGRNFSIVHDLWKGSQRERFIQELKNDHNMYKLRRHKNDHLTKN